ncbi:winged helix-turn-helix transcriptional regulator [Cupriavidus sp. P-10]|uniref:MarR family winged helix-turn-helix transcriptional regulator n=1 Tax=Cupriavidus sp. P-10 TaxID=2027911 RepID=UPI000E2F457D|nr:MarR family winged helix-turn-helix transcriptional regulator [Cupriavidus sp. P-10]BDB24250.1 winged helix-turn-helix transcriptional regulator [Cupriavidus sp. P-10]
MSAGLVTALATEGAALSAVLVAASRLRRATQQGATQALRAADLTVPQWLMLCHLRGAGGSTLTETAAAIDHDAGALSRAVHLLRERDLVVALKVPGDRRSVSLRISRSGEALCDRIDAHLKRQVADAPDGGMGPQELHRLLDLMEKAVTALLGRTEQG